MQRLLPCAELSSVNEIKPQAVLVLVVVLYLDATQIQVFGDRPSIFGIAVTEKLVYFGPVLILKHALQIQLIGLTFYRDAGFSLVGIIESLQLFTQGSLNSISSPFRLLIGWLIVTFHSVSGLSTECVSRLCTRSNMQ